MDSADAGLEQARTAQEGLPSAHSRLRAVDPSVSRTMTTYPIDGPGGRMFAFEVENVYIGVRQIAALISKLRDVSNIRVRRLFGPSPDVHIAFCYRGHDFIVWEPYGDSSRYWIGPDDDSSEVDITELAGLFNGYQVPFYVKVVGDLVSLKFLNGGV